MGAIALGNFAAVMYGYFDGYLGERCNENLSEDLCNQTGRARGAVFASFLFVLLIHAFVCKHPQQSMFTMNLLENKALLWSVTILGASVFPVIFIPVINDKVFLLFPIKWEWGMVFASMLVFVFVAELYKVLRRKISPIQSPADFDKAEKDEALEEENKIKAMARRTESTV
jgi:magnesium-transporting ATPase (P-type)